MGAGTGRHFGGLADFILHQRGVPAPSVLHHSWGKGFGYSPGTGFQGHEQNAFLVALHRTSDFFYLSRRQPLEGVARAVCFRREGIYHHLAELDKRQP